MNRVEIPNECIRYTSNIKTSLSESGIKLNCINPTRRSIRIVDLTNDCVPLEGNRCDYLILDSPVEHSIELKGSDLKHAIVQIKSTICQLSEDIQTIVKYCCVVYRKFPIASTKVNRFKDNFRKYYNAKLVFIKTGDKYDLNKHRGSV